MFTAIRQKLGAPSLTAWAKTDGMLAKVQYAVQIYYWVTPLLASLFLSSGIHNKPNFEPLWPLLWVDVLDLELFDVALLIKLFFILAALLAAFCFHSCWARILLFIALWQVHALESSFGFINHQWYTWLYTSAIFIFLPDIWNKTSWREIRTGLLTIWTAQAMVMLTYTMAGVHKFVRTYEQFRAGEVHGLAKEAFLYQTTWWVPQLQQPAYLLEYIVRFPYLAWAAYVALHFLQIFALWTMVRTSLQPVWLLLFLLFHFGTFLTMGIIFTEHLLLLLALFMPTPFALGALALKQRFKDLPLVAQVIDCKKYLKERKRLGSLK